MSKCMNCNISFRDPEDICPFCKCILEKEDGENWEPTYPHAEKNIKKMQKALNIYTFAAIVTEVILLGINYTLRNSFWWSFMIGAFLIYGFITLKFSVQKHICYQFKMLLQSLLAISVLVLIDCLLGFRGWSLNYVVPAAFMLIDVAIIVLMIINRRNWQSYIPMQLLIIVLSVIPFVLRHFGFSHDTIVSSISFIFAVFVFIGTLLVGGKRARDELYRRFHV